MAKEHTDEQHEVDRYQAKAKAADDISPLTWWKMNGHRFPHMQQLSRAVLAIPATSTPAQCLFSAAGLVCSKKRSRRSAEYVARLVFLHQNRNNRQKILLIYLHIQYCNSGLWSLCTHFCCRFYNFYHYWTTEFQCGNMCMGLGYL